MAPLKKRLGTPVLGDLVPWEALTHVPTRSGYLVACRHSPIVSSMILGTGTLALLKV